MKLKKKKLYTVTEYAKFKKISRTAVQKQIDNKKLKAYKQGRQWFILVESFTKKPKQFKLKL